MRRRGEGAIIDAGHENGKKRGHPPHNLKRMNARQLGDGSNGITG